MKAYLFTQTLLLSLMLLVVNASAAVPPDQLQQVPAGNYLVNIENGDEKDIMLNIEVKGSQARCVKSSDQSFDQVTGEFRKMKNGVFVVSLSNGTKTATQIWVFRRDGAAAIRENPDRGELQRATPVKGESLELPKGK